MDHPSHVVLKFPLLFCLSESKFPAVGFSGKLVLRESVVECIQAARSTSSDNEVSRLTYFFNKATCKDGGRELRDVRMSFNKVEDAIDRRLVCISTRNQFPEQRDTVESFRLAQGVTNLPKPRNIREGAPKAPHGANVSEAIDFFHGPHCSYKSFKQAAPRSRLRKRFLYQRKS
ncbi:hypothetical protein KM043_002669 [Ampulex compressa]|nr:hypothetical protein KM043_002669 [Ampulex compressa]